jgi:hypothetical protein
MYEKFQVGCCRVWVEHMLEGADERAFPVPAYPVVDCENVVLLEAY